METINLSIMQWSKVKGYFDLIGKKINPYGLTFYISIEETGPYAEITKEKLYVTTFSLSVALTTELYRELECVVNQQWTEKRWYVKYDYRNNFINN